MAERTKRTRRKVVRDSSNFAPSTQEALAIAQAIENSKIDTYRASSEIESVPRGPVYYPTVEEFMHPLEYVNKIRGEASKWGICKIVPPEGWSMPCEVDMESKKEFETKKQLVNRLQEGMTFDEGEDYNPAAYQKYASECASAWKEKHYKDDDMTPEALEKDYWDIVETNSTDFVAEYGNDIDCTEFWSGFPLSRRGRAVNGTSEEKDKTEEPAFGTEEYYRECWWNLNNMPTMPGSVLRHVKVPINGVNVPWLYMGTLFSTFCWHNEDNYLYSINYHHKGAPKQWYGVPGTRKDADGLEKVFKNFLMGRMKEEPGLLHHITTMFSPILLRKANIPVCKITQHPGEFIITFPRAFHGGFSMGPNIGEAVNFATPDWLSHGADASERYRNFSRQAVFSHDRLMFTMAQYLNEHSIKSCEMLITELSRVIREEDTLRRRLFEIGIQDVSGKVPLPRNNLVQLDEASANYDDKRLCLVCKHICFFSAVACRCSSSKVTCLRHANWLCSCPPRQKFLLTWESIPEMVEVQQSVANHLEILRAKETQGTQADPDLPPPPGSPSRKRSHSYNELIMTGTLLKSVERNLDEHKDYVVVTEPALPLPAAYRPPPAANQQNDGVNGGADLCWKGVKKEGGMAAVAVEIAPATATTVATTTTSTAAGASPGSAEATTGATTGATMGTTMGATMGAAMGATTAASAAAAATTTTNTTTTKKEDIAEEDMAVEKVTVVKEAAAIVPSATDSDDSSEEPPQDSVTIEAATTEVQAEHLAGGEPAAA